MCVGRAFPEIDFKPCVKRKWEESVGGSQVEFENSSISDQRSFARRVPRSRTVHRAFGEKGDVSSGGCMTVRSPQSGLRPKNPEIWA